MCGNSNHDLTYVSAITVNFVSSLYSLPEGETVDVCLILESGQLERSVELTLVSQENTAQQDADYVALHHPVTWEPDVEQNCFSVEIVDDHIVEGEETFQVVLASRDPAVVVSPPGTAHVNIRDNDSKLNQITTCYEVLNDHIPYSSKFSWYFVNFVISPHSRNYYYYVMGARSVAHIRVQMQLANRQSLTKFVAVT